MLFSFRQFLYWHKRNGGGGWSVAFFCCYAVGLLGGNLDLQYMRVETQKLLTDYNPNAVVMNGYWDNYTPTGGDYK